MCLKKDLKRLLPAIFCIIIFFISLSLVNVFTLVSSVSSPSEDLDGLQMILDCDPGADDAMSLLMLLSPMSKASVLAVTVAAGNTGSNNGTRNTLLTLQLANRTDIPVYPGSDHGLVYSEISDAFFGHDGLGDTFTTIPKVTPMVNIHAAQVLADIVKEKPDEITVLATGPLTNIALAIHLNPRFLEQVKVLVVLGGSFKGGGNKKPGVEFNFYADPEAAAFVLSKVPKDKPLTLIPLETVKEIGISKEWRLEVFGRLNNSLMRFLNRAESLSLMKVHDGFWKPYDQTATAVLLRPDLVTSEVYLDISVETCGPLARGAVFKNEKSSRPNARIITGVNRLRLQELFMTYLDFETGIDIE